MKLKYLLSIVLTSSLLFAGCAKDESTASFDNIKLDKTYLIVPETGGQVSLTVTATEAWKFVIDENWPEVISFNKDENGKTIKATHDRFGNLTNEEADIKEKTASWLAADVLEGQSGDTKVTFTIPESKAGREIEIALYAGNNKQFVRVRQGSLAPVTKTCKEILEGANVGASYIVSGTVSQLGNYASYGAFWVNDGTGEVQIYGSTKESRENYPDVEVGDVVTFSGTWSSYKNFENAEISEHIKSLLKITTEPATVSKEGGELIVEIEYKGNGVFPTLDPEYSEWITFENMTYKAGEPSKLDPNPADVAIAKFKVAANPGGGRSGAISFSSHQGEDNSSVTYEFTQDGSIIETNIAGFLAAEVSTSVWYRLEGRVSNIKNTTYGNFNLTDASGTVYVYGLTAAQTADGKNDKSFSTIGLKEGDIVTIIGTRDAYDNSPQVGGTAYYVSHESVTISTVEEFLAAAESEEVFYQLTGTVVRPTGENTKFDLEKYGNFAIKDATGDVYVYGVTTGYKGESKKFSTLGVKEGDEITIVGYRTSHNGLNQVGGAWYVSHTPKSAE